MHTLITDDNWISIGDSELNEESIVIIRKLNNRSEIVEEYSIPYRVLLNVVCNQIRNNKIAEIEQMTDSELLKYL
jgi:hypothetical protein